MLTHCTQEHLHQVKLKAGAAGKAALIERYGENPYSKIGAKGGRPRLLSIDQLREKYPEKYKKGGRLFSSLLKI